MTAITATPAGGDEDYTFAIDPALPAGLGIDPDTGTISGTPTVAAASATYRVTLTDGQGSTATATLSLGVEDDEQRIIDTFTEATAAFIADRMDRILAA